MVARRKPGGVDVLQGLARAIEVARLAVLGVAHVVALEVSAREDDGRRIRQLRRFAPRQRPRQSRRRTGARCRQAGREPARHAASLPPAAASREQGRERARGSSPSALYRPRRTRCNVPSGSFETPPVPVTLTYPSGSADKHWRDFGPIPATRVGKEVDMEVTVRLRVLGTLVGLLTGGGLAHARPASGQQPVFRASVDRVAVATIVRTKNGRPVTDLKQEDFQVFDTGVRRADRGVPRGADAGQPRDARRLQRQHGRRRQTRDRAGDRRAHRRAG